MIVGFTGSRLGMTPAQRQSLRAWLRQSIDDIKTIHHGNCVGADEQFSCAVVDVAGQADGPYEIAHPCDLPHLQWKHSWADERTPIKPPLVRNNDIVLASDILLACPNGPEVMRSGTWATIRIARKRGKPIVVFWPDGSVTTENETQE